MSTMSIDAIISLVVGVPSLIVAILTYWEARRVRHEQGTYYAALPWYSHIADSSNVFFFSQFDLRIWNSKR